MVVRATAAKALERQPDKLDYSSPTQFRFGINQLPKVEFFTTACNIPGITLGETSMGTPFKDIPIIGDKFTNKHGVKYEVELSRLIRVFNNNIWQNKKSVK